MKRLLLALCLSCFPIAVLAGDFPALFDVTGVASDDTLNIRAKPEAGSQKVGTFSFDQQNIEVITLSSDEKWGMVGLGEVSGWVAVRFLERVSSESWAHDTTSLACSGTEPFWSTDITDARQTLEFQLFDNSKMTFETAWQATPRGFTGGTLGLLARADNGDSAYTTIVTGQCSDGMSDRTFGMNISIFLSQGEQVTGYQGCCSLQSD